MFFNRKNIKISKRQLRMIGEEEDEDIYRKKMRADRYKHKRPVELLYFGQY